MLRTTPRPVRLDDGAIHVFESRHAPGFEMEMGAWDFDKICFVRQGRCKLVTPETAMPLRAGQVTLAPSGQRHRFEDDPADPAALVVICFRPGTLLPIPGQHAGYVRLRRALHGAPPLDTAQSHRKDEIRACLQRMVFEQTTARDGHETATWGLLLQLLVMLSRTEEEASMRDSLAPAAKAFARSLDVLHETFTEPIRIANLAAMAGISYRHYTSLFRAETGVTVNAYITRLRVNFAKARLVETGNIAFAALDAGFGDLSHFYRVFKAATGLTPGDYIQMQEQGPAVSGSTGSPQQLR